MTGLFVLFIFLIFAVLMYTRRLPALLAVPFMALAMALAAGVPFGRLGTIVTTGSAALAPVYVAVIFGALLGRVALDTGIARTLVNLAAEYGGDRPFALALVVCAVVAVLFTSLSGLGAIIMVGSVVLPIMMTTGVPRKVASTLFLMAFALGFIFNIANWTFYTKLFGVVPQQMVRYAIALAVVDAIALVAYALIAFRRDRGYATNAVTGERRQPPGVNPLALLAPILPLVLYYAFHMDATPAFAISAIYGAVLARPRDAVRTLVAAAIRGVEDVAPAILLFIGIGILLTATSEPQFRAALEPLVGGGWLRNPIAYVVAFGLASPLVLYRGPLNPFGVGIAIFTALLASNALPPIVIVAAVMAVVQVQNVCDPTNTANVWVANFTGTPIDEITKRTLPFQVAVATVACILVVTVGGTLFGMPAFSAIVPPAYADALPAVSLAPPNASGRVGVEDDGSVPARAGADAVASALSSHGLTALRTAENPNAAPCDGKPYASYVLVKSSTFALASGTDLDVGLVLEDCGGWIVDEWHDHEIVPSEDASAGRTLALQGLDRLDAWRRAVPQRAANLFARGVAMQGGDPPSYFYALFKTVDGNMRAYVRAGGPAYRDGLRTGDVIDKLDGRDWWTYGTYQTQSRAYDGLPHTFEVERGAQTVDVRLGTPLSPAEIGNEAVEPPPSEKPDS